MTDEEWLERYNVLKKAYKELDAQIKTIGTSYHFASFRLEVRAFPYINISFSSSGEDLWLRQCMKARFRSGRPGFYVDLGCNHPWSTSNSFLYYSYNWRGVCIDANLRFKDEWKAFRPRDTFVNAAVSDLGQALYFAEKNVPAGNKVARVALRPDDFPPDYNPPIEVPARTLADILREHVPAGTAIDFMSVDVEDSELPALRSNDWDMFRPRVVFIECGTGFDPLKPLEFDTIAFLSGLGYAYRGFSNNNVLMTEPDFDARNQLVLQGRA